MSNYYKTDAMDLQLYAVMPHVHNPDADIYDAVEPVELPQKSWDRLLRRILRRIRYAERHERYIPMYEICKRAVAVILVVMSIGFASVMSIEAVREAVWETITTWYEEKIHFQYVIESDVEIPDEILEYKEPILSDDFEKIDRNKTEHMYSLNYKNNLINIYYHQGKLEYYMFWLSNHDTSMRDIMIHEYTGYITESYIDNILYYSIIWHDNTYAYMLTANTEVEYIHDIAETIN